MGPGVGRIQGRVSGPPHLAAGIEGSERRIQGFTRLWRVVAPGAIPLVIYFAVLLLAPLGLLVAYSFWKAGFFAVTHTFTVQNYAKLLSSPLYMQILAKTLACALAVG